MARLTRAAAFGTASVLAVTAAMADRLDAARVMAFVRDGRGQRGESGVLRRYRLEMQEADVIANLAK